MFPKAKEIKAKAKKNKNKRPKKKKLGGFKSFCTAKKTTDKMKRQPTEWEKIPAKHMTNKE